MNVSQTIFLNEQMEKPLKEFSNAKIKTDKDSFIITVRVKRQTPAKPIKMKLEEPPTESGTGETATDQTKE